MRSSPKQTWLFFLLLLALSSVHGQNNSSRLDDFIVKIAIVSPGDEIYMWWGHVVLVVEDTRLGQSRIYEWGAFTYPGDSFLRDFISGDVRYFCSAGYLDMDMLASGDWEITAYTLDLDRSGKETVLNFAENCALPENCFYDYQEFRDNCATRIRDIIDMGTGGRFMEAFGVESGRYTIRQLLRRYTWYRPFSDWFLCFLMGQNFDKEISPWEEMFLPIEIARNITGFTYTDNSGAERRLVSAAETINSSKKQRLILEKAPETWPFAIMAGVIIAVFLLLIRAWGKKQRRVARVLLGLSQAILGLFLGVSGCVLLFGLLFMSDYIQQNANLLFVNPLLLITMPLGILSACGSQKGPLADKVLRVIWSFVFIAGCFTLLLRIFPFFYQQNLGVVGLIAPVAFALSGFPEKIFRFYAGLHNRKAFPRSSF